MKSTAVFVDQIVHEEAQDPGRFPAPRSIAGAVIWPNPAVWRI